MSVEPISASLTLILEIANKVAFGTEAVDYILGLVDLNRRSLNSKLWVCVNHLCFTTITQTSLKFKFINDKNLTKKAHYRVILEQLAAI